MVEKVTIKGAHRGYKRGAIFELINGQVWEQTSSEYDYQYEYRPDARLDASGSRGRIKVEGHDEWVDVRRLR